MFNKKTINSNIIIIFNNNLCKAIYKSFLVLLVTTLFACENVRNSMDEIKDKTKIDEEANLNRKEFEKSMYGGKKTAKENLSKRNIYKNRNSVEIPKLSKMIATAPPPRIGGDKYISFSTTEQVPLKDALIELARVAKIDIDLDPSISGGIILNARSRPLKEVLDRIATLGKLRYSYQNGILRFERDAPYYKNYFVDFLSSSELWDQVEENLNAIIEKINNNPPASQSQKSSNSEEESEADTKAEDSSAEQIASTIKTNKPAGLITVFATKAQHQEISKYLDDVNKSSSAQVLIEAKVVEVNLKKEFQSGINWDLIDGNGIQITASSTSVADATSSLSIKLPNIAKSIKLPTGGKATANLSTMIGFLDTFGTTRAISSPRINAMNNQEAELDFSEKYIYFTVSASQSTQLGTGGSGSATTSTLNVTKNEEPIGTQLKITPSINVDLSEVVLDIEPTLSVRSGEVLDPSVGPDGKSLGNKVPIVKSRTMKTTAKIKSGSVLVIGGLLNETFVNSDIGVPLISEIPFLGNLFKYKSRSTNIIETVIFIKATIINPNNSIKKSDREFHDKFVNDREKYIN